MDSGALPGLDGPALCEPSEPMIRHRLSFCLIAALTAWVVNGASPSTEPSDWPQFLGPSRDGHIPAASLEGIPKDGWPLRWKASVGEGFSGPVVVSDRVYLFHRIGGEEVMSAFGLADGVLRWKQALPTAYSARFGGGDGPSATPAADDQRVFALGASGRLRAVSAQDGRLLWQVDCAERFGADPGFFGFGSSPLLLGDRLIVQVGGPEASVVAFAVADGRVLWKSGADEAGYGSPVPRRRGGQQEVLCFHRAGLCVLDPATGVEKARFPWRSRMQASVNAASPIGVGDGIFLTSSYGTGAVLLKPDGNALRVAWSGDEALSAHFATPVLVDGFLYGFNGRQEGGPDFRCIEAATGKVRWSWDRIGSGSVQAAGRTLVLLMESGEVRVLEANPEKPLEKGRFQAAGSGARALPAMARGRFLLRDRSHLLCLEVAR